MKKSARLLTAASAVAAASLAIVTGCTYDVAEPLWNQPYTAPPTPIIAQVQPSSAPAGVNTILITGQNLGGVPNTDGIYFDNTSAEIVQKSATTITVRRPNLVSDSCTVKLVSDSALVVAKVGFGKVDRVMERVGDFRDNITLSTVAGDSAGNLIVASGVSPVTIWSVSPAGVKTPLPTSGLSLRPPFDAAVRGGVLYLAGNNREIQQVNLTTGAASRWTQLPPGRIARAGDFDANGYFYAGGVVGSDLCIIPPNPPTTLTLSQITLAGAYATEEILVVKVLGGYVYVASRPTVQTPIKIWRHSVGAGGSLGTQELVLDLGGFAEFSSRLVRAISFSAGGVMYVTTDAANPLLVYNPVTGSLDYFYKGIVPPLGKDAYWGTNDYLYMISGDVDNTDTGLRWNIVRVTMGTTGAPSP